MAGNALSQAARDKKNNNQKSKQREKVIQNIETHAKYRLLAQERDALLGELEVLKKQIEASIDSSDLAALQIKHESEKELLLADLSKTKEELMEFKKTFSNKNTEKDELAKELEKAKEEIKNLNESLSVHKKEELNKRQELESDLEKIQDENKKLKRSIENKDTQINIDQLNEIFNYLSPSSAKMLRILIVTSLNEKKEWFKLSNTTLQQASTTNGAVTKFKKDIEFFKLAFHKKEAEEGQKMLKNFYKLNISAEAIAELIEQSSQTSESQN